MCSDDDLKLGRAEVEKIQKSTITQMIERSGGKNDEKLRRLDKIGELVAQRF